MMLDKVSQSSAHYIIHLNKTKKSNLIFFAKNVFVGSCHSTLQQKLMAFLFSLFVCAKVGTSPILFTYFALFERRRLQKGYGVGTVLKIWTMKS
jgi:hypothetical protein